MSHLGPEERVEVCQMERGWGGEEETNVCSEHQRTSCPGKELGKEKEAMATVHKYLRGVKMVPKGAFTN
jgi:hypothetical protein